MTTPTSYKSSIEGEKNQTKSDEREREGERDRQIHHKVGLEGKMWASILNYCFIRYKIIICSLLIHNINNSFVVKIHRFVKRYNVLVMILLYVEK